MTLNVADPQRRGVCPRRRRSPVERGEMADVLHAGRWFGVSTNHRCPARPRRSSAGKPRARCRSTDSWVRVTCATEGEPGPPGPEAGGHEGPDETVATRGCSSDGRICQRLYRHRISETDLERTFMATPPVEEVGCTTIGGVPTFGARPASSAPGSAAVPPADRYLARNADRWPTDPA